jgi:hypothetical protein
MPSERRVERNDGRLFCVRLTLAAYMVGVSWFVVLSIQGLVYWEKYREKEKSR